MSYTFGLSGGMTLLLASQIKHFTQKHEIQQRKKHELCSADECIKEVIWFFGLVGNTHNFSTNQYVQSSIY